MSSSERRKIRLGIMIPKDKNKKLNLRPRIQKCCDQENIEIIEIDIHRELEEQGPFDVLVHKVVDFTKDGLTNTESDELIRRTKCYCQKQSGMAVIDDIEVITDLTSRGYQYGLLDKCTMILNDIQVYAPKSLEISEDCSLGRLHELIEEAGIQFPVLGKPLASSTAKGAHEMSLVFSKEQLCDLPRPCLLQEFRNHGGVIYKVFVMGERINICERPSVKDLDCDPCRKSLVFDTRDISKTGKVFVPELHKEDPNKREWLSCDEKPDMLNLTVVKAIHKKLSELTGLKLYGLDILKDNKGDYALVDLNHFPGYTGVRENEFVRNFIEMILQSVK